MRTSKQEIEIQKYHGEKIHLNDDDSDDEDISKKDGSIHGASPMGAVHSMYYAKVWWGENTPMHIMQ